MTETSTEPDKATNDDTTTTTTTGTDPAAETEKWKALARKHEARAKDNADKAKRLDELEESSKTELQKATARAEAAEKALAEKTLDGDRLTVALAKGLDPELAPLLNGATREEIETQAELLASRLKTTNKPATKPLKSGASGKDDSGITGKERAAAALRQYRGQP